MTETEATPRRGVPVWIQGLVLLGLMALLALLAFGLIRTNLGTIRVNEEVPDFELSLFDGYSYDGQDSLSISALRGKVIVLNFWASWCKPCEQEAADLEAAWRHYAPSGQVVFLGVDYTDTPTPAMAYLKKFDITYPNSPDLGSRASQLFRIKGVPETYFIDREGVLRYIQVGPFESESQIRQQVELLLNQ